MNTINTIDLQYWKVKTVHDKWVQIECPILDDAAISKPFWIRKQIVKELISIEKMIKLSTTVIGWIGHTNIKHYNIILMFTKLGASPFRISIKDKQIWFNKLI